jgi:hypothetical protein
MFYGIILEQARKLLKKIQAGREQAVEQTRIYRMSLPPLATREIKSVELGT